MKIGNKIFDTENKTYIMGILNVTPDSFSDGGKYNQMDQALLHVEEMIADGADILDIGGESTRPGHTRITDEEEICRIVPVIERIKKEYDIPVSVDTYKSQVAKEALEAGADLVNDIWGLKADAKMAPLLAKYKVPCCIMHNRKNMKYKNFLEDITEDLKESIKEHGVLTPVLVRKLDNGNYQILSGHNRCECAKAVGFKTVPCVVLSNLTDDDALMIVLDSNTKQRGITEMKISEQAHIYALDVAVNKRQGKRSDLIKSIEKNLEILSNDAVSETLSQFDTKLDTTQEIGDKYGISRATVARLLRIDTLIYELKTRIDDGEIAVNAGVELSYLTQQEQEIIDEVICEFNYKLDINKSKQLRELSKSGKLNKVTAVDVFEGRYNKQ